MARAPLDPPGGYLTNHPLTVPMSADKLRTRVARLVELLDALEHGTTLSWGDGERRTVSAILRSAGITLVSATAAGRLHCRIKPRAIPVVNAYFGAPLQRYTDLYVYGAQTTPLKTEPPPASPPGLFGDHLDGRIDGGDP